MSYIGRPFLNVPANTFAKEDFTGADTGTNNSITNSIVLSREMPGLNASNIEVFINNVRQEPDVAYFIREDSTGLPIIVEFSEALNSNDSIYVIHKGLGPGTERTGIAAGSVTATMLADSLKEFTLNSFTGDGTDTTFTLAAAPNNANSLLVTVDGVVQKPATNYSVSSTTLTFTSAPANNAEIEVRDLGIRTSVRRGTGFTTDTLTVSGSSTSTMALGSSVLADDVFISINGIMQTPTSAYTISGATVTFAANLSDGDVVVARYQR